jgi:hypothetical protein
MGKHLPPPPKNSAGYAPPRSPGSARRTSSIDVSWPEGRAGNMHLVGRARDLVTPLAGAPIVCAEDGFVAEVRMDRTIVAIRAEPERGDLSRLVGERGGGHLRVLLNEVLPQERNGATPLYLILDDISGASLVAGWAWSQWEPNWADQMREAMKERGGAGRSMEGVCIGFAPGSSALEPDRTVSSGAPAPDLRRPDDPQGWHAFTAQDGAVGMRRARRVDVRLEDENVIDAAFQDSSTTPDAGRMVLHEYRLSATADPKTLQITSLAAEPRVLPFPECPSAAHNLTRLLGTRIDDLRATVLEELRGTAGCTHLNDAVRSLAEAPALVGLLQTHGGLAGA